MNVKKIPLAKRIECLNENKAADPEYYVSVVVRWANMPACDYMAAFSQENEELCRLLSITKEEQKNMTYRDMAIRLAERMALPEFKAAASKAVPLLAIPFINYNREGGKTNV